MAAAVSTRIKNPSDLEPAEAPPPRSIAMGKGVKEWSYIESLVELGSAGDLFFLITS